MTHRILFLVNGLGLGNSTRCHAIAQELSARGAIVSIVTAGNGVGYFDDRPEITNLYEIEPLRYGVGNGRLSVLRTILSAADLLQVARRNRKKIRQILERERPDAVLADSVYTVREVRRLNIPLLSLNNADVVHMTYRQLRSPPRSIKAQFYCVEEMDYLFHRLVPDVVLSPTLDPYLPAPGGNTRRIGPIVRPIPQMLSLKGNIERVLVMLSGSQFGSPVTFSQDRHGYCIDVVGRDAPDNSEPLPDNIRYHGKMQNNFKLLQAADVMVVNGGFSAVSEAFVLRKPVVVLPIENHAEQWINGYTIEKLGVGVMADMHTMEDALVGVVENVERYRRAYSRLPPPPNGALQAAKAILGTIGR